VAVYQSNGFPNQVRSLSPVTDLVSIVDASDVDSLQQEVLSIETALGTAATTNPLVSTFTGTWTTTMNGGTSWNTIADRLLNIEAGLVNGVGTASNYVSKSGGSTISVTTSTGAPGLTLVTTSGTNNLLKAAAFTLSYLGIPQVNGSNVLYVGSSDYTSLVNSINAASGTGGAAIAKSVFTAAGDMLYATAAGTPTNLPIGSAGQYLMVMSGMPVWTTMPMGVPTSTLTTNGDLMYYNSGITRLPVGSSGQVLTVVSGLPSWQAPSSAFVSQTNGTVSTASTSLGVVRNVWTSTATPTSSNGADGDIWLVYV